MQTKTYFASSVPAALEVARRELGEDALLVNSKQAAPAARAFGRLEVTFAFDSKPAAAASQPVSELEEIRQQISALRMQVARPVRRAADDDDYPVASTGDRQIAKVQELTAKIPSASFAEMKAGESRALALVGPPGRGKTTTLVKIAMRYGLAQRVPVKIYTAGSHGICGEEQMARFALILGVPFLACESLDSLSLALNGDGWKGLALIDTPGISPGATAEIATFGRFFARRHEIEKHLVLRADARSADMTHVISRFSPVGISRLLFTGVDEAVSPGAMVETLVRSQIPAALVGTGQQIPDDLEAMNVSGIVRAVCGENALAAAAA